jgi:hypothetical protein
LRSEASAVSPGLGGTQLEPFPAIPGYSTQKAQYELLEKELVRPCGTGKQLGQYFSCDCGLKRLNTSVPGIIYGHSGRG